MALCFLQHENEIRIPELVKFGGNIQFDDEFSMKWFYTKLLFLILCSLLYVICFILYGMEYGFFWWFTYYNYLNFTFLIIYLILSLLITVRIYRYIKNNELPNCLQTSRPFELTIDNEEELDDINQHENRNNNDDDMDDPESPMNRHKNIKIEQLKSSFLGNMVTFFQYISLIGLWCGSILYYLHEFEIDVFQNELSVEMQFIVIITSVIIQIIAIFDFFMSGFRLKYSGFIWSLSVMIIIIILNMIQILNNNLDSDGEWNQHLFTELDWNSDIQSSLVTCFWSMAILLICNVSATFIKNICLCKWSIRQRQKQRYPRAQEAVVEVEI